MKFNNKLNLVDYLKVVQEISGAYFDSETYDYIPQIGEMFAICSFFNYCVELEDDDEQIPKPIEEISDAEKIYNNAEIMDEFCKETAIYVGEKYDCSIPSLTFGHAYYQAMDIVKEKLSDANAFATAISLSIESVLKGFKILFSEEDMEKLAKITSDIASGKLSNEAIIDAYSNSDRFKENTERANAKAVSNAIPFPQKK